MHAWVLWHKQTEIWNISHSPWSPPHRYIVWCSSVLLVSEIKCYISGCSSCGCTAESGSSTVRIPNTAARPRRSSHRRPGGRGGDERRRFNRPHKGGMCGKWRVLKEELGAHVLPWTDCSSPGWFSRWGASAMSGLTPPRLREQLVSSGDVT